MFAHFLRGWAGGWPGWATVTARTLSAKTCCQQQRTGDWRQGDHPVQRHRADRARKHSFVRDTCARPHVSRVLVAPPALNLSRLDTDVQVARGDLYWGVSPPVTCHVPRDPGLCQSPG